jgi:hypothetical protein
MTKWSDIADVKPFDTHTTAVVDKAAGDVMIADESSTLERYTINALDGRSIPVIVDNGTRSVYPVREKV